MMAKVVARVRGVGNAKHTHDDQDPSQDCSYDGEHHECQDLETRKGDSLVNSRWAIYVAVFCKHDKYPLKAIAKALKKN